MEAIQRSLKRYSKVLSHSNSPTNWYTYSKSKDEFGYTLPTTAYYDKDDKLKSFWWTKNGKTHRDELDENGRVLPAIIISNGTQYWYKNGQPHRDDLDENGRVLPAYINSNGDLYWYRNGKQHRDDLDENGRVLPAYINSDGEQEWYVNDKRHRDDLDEKGKVLLN